MKPKRYSVDISSPLSVCSYEDDNGSYVLADIADNLYDELVSALGSLQHVKESLEHILNNRQADSVMLIDQIDICNYRINRIKKALEQK